jgi:peroxiredoxin
LKRMFFVVVVCLAALALVSCACRKKTTTANPGVIGPGAQAPDFALKNLENKEVTLKSLKGKVILLDFWATWCGPCRMEIPHFKKLYDEYRSQGFEALGIALDKQGAEVVRPFVDREEVNYTVVIGNDAVAAAYGGIRAIPTTFVIDKEGKIYSKYVGVPRDIGVFEEDVKKLLGK